MATNTIRWDLTKRIVDLLRDDARMTGVLIEPGWPGQNKMDRKEIIWVHELDGALTVPFVNAGRKTRDDRFTIPFQIRVIGQKDLDATMARVSELVAVIDDLLADDPTTKGFDGLMHALVTSIRMTSGVTPDVIVGWGEVVVSPLARYL